MSLLLLALPAALAQPVEEAGAALPAEQAAVEEPAEETDPGEADAGFLLELAKKKLDAGDSEAARVLLEEVSEGFPGTAAAAEAEALLAPLVEVEQRSLQSEGKVHLAISQGLIGGPTAATLIPMTLGLELSETGYAGLALVGVGAGIGGGVAFANRNPLTAGQAWAFSYGEVMGLYHGAFLLSQFQPETINATGATLLLSEVAGGVAGGVVAARRSPSYEDVALTTHVTTLGAVNGVLVAAMFELDEDYFLPAVIIFSDLGALTGVVMAAELEIPQRRLRLISGGSYLGMTVGSIAALLVGAGYQGTFGLIMAGEVGGLALAAAATRDITHSREGQVQLAPPSLRVIPRPGGERTVEVGLLSGRF